MAKRTRGSTRPGQRRPIQRTGPRPARHDGPVAPRPISLTPEEEARAAELEAAILAEERAAEDASRRARERTRRETEPAEPAVARAGSTLAVRAAEEYAYVIRDVRRITILASVLTGILLVLWVVMQVTGSTL
jgi:hypothetical protein